MSTKTKKKRPEKTEIEKLYENFVGAFHKANPQLLTQTCLREAQLMWKQLRIDNEAILDLKQAVNIKVSEFKLKESRMTAKKMSYWDKFHNSSPAFVPPPPEPVLQNSATNDTNTAPSTSAQWYV